MQGSFPLAIKSLNPVLPYQNEIFCICNKYQNSVALPASCFPMERGYLRVAWHRILILQREHEHKQGTCSRAVWQSGETVLEEMACCSSTSPYTSSLHSGGHVLQKVAAGALTVTIASSWEGHNCNQTVQSIYISFWLSDTFVFFKIWMMSYCWDDFHIFTSYKQILL